MKQTDASDHPLAASTAVRQRPDSVLALCQVWKLDCTKSGNRRVFNREWREEEAEILADIDAPIYVMGPLLGDARRMKAC